MLLWCSQYQPWKGITPRSFLQSHPVRKFSGLWVPFSQYFSPSEFSAAGAFHPVVQNGPYESLSQLHPALRFFTVVFPTYFERLRDKESPGKQNWSSLGVQVPQTSSKIENNEFDSFRVNKLRGI